MSLHRYPNLSFDLLKYKAKNHKRTFLIYVHHVNWMILLNGYSVTFTRGWGNTKEEAQPAAYFIADSSQYQMLLSNGEAQLSNDYPQTFWRS